MKEEKTFRYCEFCDTAIEKNLSLKYKSYSIEIINSILFLSEEIVKKNKKECYTDSNAVNINGYYCNRNCLNNHLAKLLHESE